MTTTSPPLPESDAMGGAPLSIEVLGQGRAARREGLRLGLALTVLAALALVVAGLALAIYNERQVETERVKATSVQAQILAGTVAAPLAFDDVVAARKYIDALKANPQTEAVGVYGADGRLAAGWSRAGDSLPARVAGGATERHGQRLAVSAPVVEGGARLGAVYLSTVLQPWSRRAERYGGIGLLVLMAALLVGGLGAANVSLARAQRRLRREMAERARTEAALRRSQKMEALAQIETAAERSRAALRLSEAHLEFALRAGELGSWTRDLRTGHFEASPLLRAQYGFTPDEPLEKAEDFIARMHPEDRPSRGGIVGQAIADRAQFETEFRIRKLDGEMRWMMVRGRADYDEAGAPLRVAGVSMDVTERKLAEERLRFLVDELNHRVKNTLAAVQSIARQTGRASRSEGEFEAAFIARIDALARIHDLLAGAAWEGASLADVARLTLEPYEPPTGATRVALGGPKMRLGPNAAVTLAMAFHELATNAAKYGALSAPGGRVEVVWTAACGEAEILEIVWTETGGPPARAPERRGFGARFLERALGREFDGEVDLRFAATGLVCRIRLPLSAKVRMAA